VCPGPSVEPCGTSFDPPFAEDLGVLKAQLRQALEQVEEQEKAMAEALAPQTVEDVDMLETKLQEALEALKERRAEIERKSTK
jgi:hypothetical protein